MLRKQMRIVREAKQRPAPHGGTRPNGSPVETTCGGCEATAELHTGLAPSHGKGSVAAHLGSCAAVAVEQAAELAPSAERRRAGRCLRAAVAVEQAIELRRAPSRYCFPASVRTTRRLCAALAVEQAAAWPAQRRLAALHAAVAVEQAGELAPSAERRRASVSLPAFVPQGVCALPLRTSRPRNWRRGSYARPLRSTRLRNCAPSAQRSISLLYARPLRSSRLRNCAPSAQRSISRARITGSGCDR